MSKMGISVLSSYRGGLNFEAVGLSAARWWRNISPACRAASRASAISGIQTSWKRSTPSGWRRRTEVLPIGGFYKARRSGEKHAWEAQTMHMLQAACDQGVL